VTVCRSGRQLKTERSNSSHSSVENAAFARNKFNLEIVSVDDAELENLLLEAVTCGNYCTCQLTVVTTFK